MTAELADVDQHDRARQTGIGQLGGARRTQEVFVAGNVADVLEQADPRVAAVRATGNANVSCERAVLVQLLRGDLLAPVVEPVGQVGARRAQFAEVGVEVQVE